MEQLVGTSSLGLGPTSMWVAGVCKLGSPMLALAVSRRLSGLFLGQRPTRLLLFNPCAANNAVARRRCFGIPPPLCMGRRSSKIALRKGTQDAKKAKLYGKLGKQIVTAVKGGGPNPSANMELATLIEKAKQYDIPKDIIDRNIKKASDKGQQDFVDIMYEVYGAGGVGILVEVLTDNLNRTAAQVRDIVKKGGGKMANPGSVLFKFKRCGLVYVNGVGGEGDAVLLAAMDAGAEDVIEPSPQEVEDESDGYFKVVTPVEEHAVVLAKLRQAGLQVDADSSGLEMIPMDKVTPEPDAAEVNNVLVERLLELDDVDAVYSNQS